MLDVIQIKPRHKAHPNAASTGMLRDLRVPLALDALGEVRERFRVADLLHAEDVGSNLGDHPGRAPSAWPHRPHVFGTAGVPRTEQVLEIPRCDDHAASAYLACSLPTQGSALAGDRGLSPLPQQTGRRAFTSRAEKIGSSLVARRGSAEATALLDHSVCAGLF